MTHESILRDFDGNPMIISPSSRTLQLDTPFSGSTADGEARIVSGNTYEYQE
jgi:hypothetical protein